MQLNSEQRVFVVNMNYTKLVPFDETHLDAARGLF